MFSPAHPLLFVWAPKICFGESQPILHGISLCDQIFKKQQQNKQQRTTDLYNVLLKFGKLVEKSS